jgi:thiol-disulfide isomerase/thioredoxin
LGEYLAGICQPKVPPANQFNTKLLPFFGKRLTEEDFYDKVKVLIFWSSECVSCTESFAYINDLIKETCNPNKAIIMAVTTEAELKAQAKLMQKPLLHARLVSNGRIITNFYNLNTYPTFVIADRDNVINLR